MTVWKVLKVIPIAAGICTAAVCIYAHRPIGFPLDIDPDRRQRLKELAGELDLELGAVVCCTNFLEGDHVLLYPSISRDVASSSVEVPKGTPAIFSPDGQV